MALCLPEHAIELRFLKSVTSQQDEGYKDPFCDLPLLCKTAKYNRQNSSKIFLSN